MNIKAEREAAGISQADLARRIGMLQPKLSRIENGHIEATQGEMNLIQVAINPLVAKAAEILGEDEDFVISHCEPYPAAPKDITTRQAWVTKRNRNMQTYGVPAPSSGTHGQPPKKPKA